MSTSLHAVFNVVSGYVYFVIVSFNIPRRKMRFSESSQNSISEKSIFGHFEIIFFNVWILPRAGWLFPVSTFKEEYFNEKISSLDGPKKICSIFRKSDDFGHFWPPGSNFNVDFFNIRENSKKSSVSSLGAVVGNIVLNFELSIFETVRGGRVAVLQVDNFQNPWF